MRDPHSPSIETGSDQERAAFAALQEAFARQYRDVFDDAAAARSVVVVPSLSLDPDVLATITGVHHYEERMLCLLMLLRMPRTRVIFLSSAPIPADIADYYLPLPPAIP